MTTVLIFALESLCFFMRFWYVIYFGKSDTIKFISHIEGAVTNIIQFKIGTYFIFVQTELCFLCFLKIVAPVPSFRGEVSSFFFNFSLNVS